MIACRNVPRKALPGPGLLLLLPLTVAGCGAGPEAGGDDETLDPASPDASVGSVAERPPSSPPPKPEASSAAQREAPEGRVSGGGEPQEASSPPAGPPQRTARTESSAARDADSESLDSGPRPEPSGLPPELSAGESAEPVTPDRDGPDPAGLGPAVDLLATEELLDPVSIPAGTLIPTVMQVTLSTRTHQAGDTFHLRVSEEILAADGMVLVPEGTRLEGRVTDARRSTDSDEDALLSVVFETLLLDGVRIPLDAVVAETELETSSAASDTRTAITVVTGAAAGAVLGRILGGDTRSAIQGAAVGALGGAGVAFVTRDGHAVIREGTRVVVQLESPAVLSPVPSTAF